MRIRTPGSPVSELAGKIGTEYLTAPIHVLLAATFSRYFPGFRQKVLFYQVRRRQNAFGMLQAADIAMQYGYSEVTIVEFGVASGGGIMNMYDISKYVEKETGIAFKIYGFDSGVGLYKPVDYRDHPEAFTEGDYPLIDKDLLAQNTDGSVELIIGNVQKTVPGFVEKLSPDAPLAFFSVDVDYYSFAAGCLKILMGDPECYLPHFWCYFDDIALASANHWCDELLAIEEFNHANKLRKIDKSDMLKTY